MIRLGLEVKTLTSMPDFHKRAMPPALPIVGTNLEWAKPIALAREEKQEGEDNLISERKRIEGWCTKTRLSNALITLGWESPWQFHTKTIMRNWRACLGSSPQP